MTYLSSADAEQDAQNFHVGHPLRQFGVEARSALLNPGKVKTSGVGDRLNKVHIVRVSVRSRNRRMLSNGECGNGVRKRVAEVRVLGEAAVTSPPAGIDRELHQVRQTPDLVGSGCLAAGQSAKAIKIDRIVRDYLYVSEIILL